MAENTCNYSGLMKDLRQSFRAGKLRTIESRLHQLGQLHRMVTECEDEFYDAIYKDLRKCKTEGNLMEILQVKIALGETTQQLYSWAKPERVSGDLINRMNTCEIRKDPLGVVLIIGPWNYPIQTTLLPLIGAIAAGNCVVIKPSEIAVNTAMVMEKLFKKYMDTSCIAVVNGAIPETTALLKERFDHICYTGNGMVGRIVMAAAAKHLTPVTLELGGKCPAIIDSTCNFETITQRIAWAKYCNSGQTCLAVDYLICIDGAEKKVIEGMKKAIEKFYGKDPQKSESYGRIINKRHFDRVAKLIDKSKVVVGGQTDEDDLYIAPTIMNNNTREDLVMKEEIFGPLLPIVTVKTVEEAIQIVNDGDKPLALYVFSNNYALTEQVVNETSSGGVCINDALVHGAVPNLPFGGVGESGMGSYHGKASFDCFTHRKSYMYKNQMLEGANAIRYPPYDENWSVLKWAQWLLTPKCKY